MAGDDALHLTTTSLLLFLSGSDTHTHGNGHPSLWMSRLHSSSPSHTQQLAVVCLQAQHVAGLPASAEGRQVQLRLLQQAHQPPPAAAAAMCRGGVAAFHDQLLLLHCAPVSTIGGVAVAVMLHGDGSPRQHDDGTSVVNVTVAEQLRRPSPRVLSFVLGPSAARPTTTAGAVLSLTLHHRLVTEQPPRRRSCLLLLRCLLPPGPGPAAAPTAEEEAGCFDDDDDQSSGFITIDKGTISRSRRRPPSDNLATTDDEENNVTMGYWWPSLQFNEESKVVEDEFLAMLELGGAGDGLDLDALIKDAEAELAARPT